MGDTMTEKTTKGRIEVLGKLLRVFIKNIFPRSLLNARARAVEKRQHLKYQGLGVEHVFREIYEKNEWGGKKGEFYSGSGSHDPNIVTPYIQEIQVFLTSLLFRPTIVDLGSGDFNIGRNFVDKAERYYACDIVPELQEYNRKHFSFLNVEFVCLNIVEDDLPDGDVIFLRQVLQHLSNEHIQKVIDKCRKYSRWVVTEHLPAGIDFKPNVDITAGCGIRVLFNSGIDLMKPPFSVNGYVTRVLCEVPENGGVIRTTLFELSNENEGDVPARTIDSKLKSDSKVDV